MCQLVCGQEDVDDLLSVAGGALGDGGITSYLLVTYCLAYNQIVWAHGLLEGEGLSLFQGRVGHLDFDSHPSFTSLLPAFELPSL